MRHRAAASTLGERLDLRSNSLGFLRLFFAAIVLVAHAWGFGGYGTFGIGRSSFAELALMGFFAISGFLVTRSRERATSTLRYAWHRAVRILPAFWLCLILTASVFGSLTWLHTGRSLGAYLSAGHGPIQYVISNAAIKIHFYDIAGTPVLPAPKGYPSDGPQWDASLWSLYWEVVCYAVVVLLAWIGALHTRRHLTVIVLIATWAVGTFHSLDPHALTGVLGTQHAFGVLRFVPPFLSGAVLYLYRDRIPLSDALAGGAALVGLALLYLPDPDGIVAPFFAYVCLWAAVRLPFRKVGVRRDLSYGIYIYAFPVQQLLRVYGLPKYGELPFMLATAVGTTACAFMSWYAVEKIALSHKDWAPNRQWAPMRGLLGKGVATDAIRTGGDAR